jgi:hypothetical protein
MGRVMTRIKLSNFLDADHGAERLLQPAEVGGARFE